MSRSFQGTDHFFGLPLKDRHICTKFFRVVPVVFTKVAEAALGPLWEVGIRILNYLDN